MATPMKSKETDTGGPSEREHEHQHERHLVTRRGLLLAAPVAAAVALCGGQRQDPGGEQGEGGREIIWIGHL